MKISQIFKNITPKEKKKEIEKIKRIKLSKDLQKWVNKYEKVCGERGIFFWKWMYNGIQETALSVHSRKYQTINWKCEFLLVIFVVIFDYVVDKKRNNKILDELFKIPFLRNQIKYSRLNKDEKIVVNFANEIWYQIENIIKHFPRYEEFKEVWKYDISQIMNAMRYDYMVNNNHFLINKTEYWLYAPHTMQITAAITSNLMCLPKFDMRELGLVRNIALKIQEMARISNWISTWEREIKDNDYSSGIFAYALEEGILSYGELKKENQEMIISKIKSAKIETKMMNCWDNCYLQVCEYKKIKSINVKELLFGEVRAFILYMVTKGKI